jgi:NADPH-dependent ferric siderophore reductase
MQEKKQTRRVRPRPSLRAVEVSRAERLTPHLIRVTFAGPDLEGFVNPGPAGHVRLWFPQAGLDRPVLPEWGEDGPVMAEGMQPPATRVYTPRRWDAAASTLDVDFVTHEGIDGPGTQWAKNAAPGSALVISGPSGHYMPDPGEDRFVLAGDHTGLPAILTILEALPAKAAARAFIQVPDASDELPVDTAARADVTWVRDGAGAPWALAEALKEASLTPEDGLAYVACEASVMREIRRHLLYDRGFDKARIVTHGYWKYDTQNYPDHDFGDDV